MDINLVATFLLLIGLELVLGIDNILVLSILTDRLPPEQRNRARYLGLGLALLTRCLFLLGASYLLRLSTPVALGFSWKDWILIAGGGFLLFKAVREIHHVVEGHADDGSTAPVYSTMSGAIIQILLLDMVFSIDSVITAVGLTDSLPVIYAAVLVSFIAVLIFAGRIAGFINAHPALKILALSFLVTIGVTLCVEGFHGHVPKSYIYLPMGFALGVELLQMRFTYNLGKKQKAQKPNSRAK
ncbi:MAG: TerC family protein [Bdellovibrionales bacterium]